MASEHNGIPTLIAPGELLDKLTILDIKLEKVTDPEKRQNIQHEWDVLTAAKTEHIPNSDTLSDLYTKLKTINTQLWNIEDDIRDCERDQDFGPKFIELARSVYITNDQRAAIKKEINHHLGSKLVEEKSYQAY